MSLIKPSRAGLVLLISGVLLAATPAAAYDRSELEQRLAQRRAQLEARRAERAAERAARNEEVVVPELEPEEACRCTTRLSLDKPSLQWQSGKLVFVPRINVSIRSRGEERTPWTAHLDWNGATGAELADVAAPAGVNFSGSQNLFSGQCGDTYSFNGWKLPAVTLIGLSRGLVDGQKVDGRVQMEAKLSGCGVDEEKRAFDFALMDFGNLRIRSWRTVR